MVTEKFKNSEIFPQKQHLQQGPSLESGPVSEVPSGLATAGPVSRRGVQGLPRLPPGSALTCGVSPAVLDGGRTRIEAKASVIAYGARVPARSRPAVGGWSNGPADVGDGDQAEPFAQVAAAEKFVSEGVLGVAEIGAGALFEEPDVIGDAEGVLDGVIGDDDGGTLLGKGFEPGGDALGVDGGQSRERLGLITIANIRRAI